MFFRQDQSLQSSRKGPEFPRRDLLRPIDAEEADPHPNSEPIDLSLLREAWLVTVRNELHPSSAAENSI